MNNLPEPLQIYTWLDDDGLVTAKPEERVFLHNNLQIPENDPLTLYKILGVPEGETNPKAIESACDMRLGFLRTLQNGGNMELVQHLLNIVSAAKNCLLIPNKRAAYDSVLTKTRENLSNLVPDIVIKTNVPKRSLSRNSLTRTIATVSAAVAVLITSTGIVKLISSSGKKENNDTTRAVAKANDLTSPRSAPPATNNDERSEGTGEDDGEETVPYVEGYVVDNNEPQKPETEDLAVAPPTPSSTPLVDITPVSSASSTTTASPIAGDNSFIAVQQPGEPTPTIEIQQRAPTPKPEPRRGLWELVDKGNNQPTQAPVAAVTPSAPRPDVRVATIKPEEVASMKATLETAIAQTPPAEKASAILKWANDPEMLKDPAAMKAIYELAFSKARDVKDVATCKQIVDLMAGQPGIFLAEDIVQHQKLLVALLSEQAKVSGTPAPKRLGIVQEILAVAEATAQRNPAEALRFIADARKALPNTPIKERRDYDAKITSTEAAIKKILADNMRAALEAEQEKALAAKEAADFDQANKTLSENPFDQEARKIRGQIYLSRGEALKALEDLAASNHAKAGLARESMLILKSPKTAKGKRTLEIAREWKTLAAMTKNGKQRTLYRIAYDLFGIAIGDATDEPLNVIEKGLARKDLESIPTTGSVRSPESPDAQSSWTAVTHKIDLSKGIGKWSQNRDGSITVQPGHESRVALPLKVPASGDFEARVRFTAHRTSGNNAVQVMLPLGNGATGVFNGWPENGGVSGVNNIDGQGADKNPTRTNGNFLDNKPHVFEVSVKRTGENGTVTATVDGKPLFTWTGNCSSLQFLKGQEIDPGSFGIGAYNSQCTFSNIEVLLQTNHTQPVNGGAVKPASAQVAAPEKAKPANLEPVRPKIVPEAAAWNPEMRSWILAGEQEISMNAAIQLAQRNNATLVVVRSQAENDSLQALVRGGKIFLGFMKGPDGKLMCADGSKATYQNWGPGEGSNSSERIVLMDTDGTWQDYPDSATALPCFQWKAK